MKHVNLPKNGIECPCMWVERDNFGRVVLCLGDMPDGHKKDPRKFPMDTVATHVIFDPGRPEFSDKTMSECINEIVKCLRKPSKYV